MTITLSLQEVLVAILLIVSIIAVIKLIAVLFQITPTIKSLNNTMEDVEELVSKARKGADKVEEVAKDASELTNHVVTTLKGNASIVSAATNLVNATASLARLVKGDSSKK